MSICSISVNAVNNSNKTRILFSSNGSFNNNFRVKTRRHLIKFKLKINSGFFYW